MEANTAAIVAEQSEESGSRTASTMEISATVSGLGGAPESDHVIFRSTPMDNRATEQIYDIDGHDLPLSGRQTAGAPILEPQKAKSACRQLFYWIKRTISSQINLPDSTCALIAFWTISTWFPEAFTVFPCLVLTGPNHEGTAVLRALKPLCYAAALMADFRRADLKVISWNFRTLLISEPNINKQTADLVGNLTNQDFILVEQGSYLYGAGSKALYIGEDPGIKRIQHSIYVNVATLSNAGPPARHQWLQQAIANLPGHLCMYRDNHLEQVRNLEFNPSGLSLEAHAIANALGSCIVDEPELQSILVSLLRPHDRQQAADLSDSVEALVAGAALTLCHQNKSQVFVKEIAAEVNRALEDRGENVRFSAEKVGHKLKKIGLLTRTLSQAGKGLFLDEATKIRVHEVSAAYGVEGLMVGDGILHCQSCLENQ